MWNKSFLAFLCFSLFCNFHLLNGHLCLFSPAQRDGFSLNIPGDDSCYRKVGPCGDTTSGSVRTKIKSGSIYNVEFQQNLNHYYAGNPGTMDVSFAVGANPNESDFKVLYTVNDYNAMNQITQTNFSSNITMPNVACDECVLRVRYLSNNPDENDRGEIFYQCADIELYDDDDNDNIANIDHSNINVINKTYEQSGENNENDCCAPASFSTSFTHEIPSLDYTSKGIMYYDKNAQQMRIDITIGEGSNINIYNGKYSMIMNFTNGLQYYLNVNNNTCDIYGLDFWNDWCYGNTYNQTETFVSENTNCLNTFGMCNEWNNMDFIFQAYVNTCLPSILKRGSGEYISYYDAQVGPISSDIFMPIDVCLQQRTLKHPSLRRKTIPKLY